VLDDFSRFIVAWKLCATMKAQDVTATLDLALAASGVDQMTVAHRPRLLSDNGSSYVASDLELDVGIRFGPIDVLAIHDPCLAGI
jgi:putative transposase